MQPPFPTPPRHDTMISIRAFLHQWHTWISLVKQFLYHESEIFALPQITSIFIRLWSIHFPPYLDFYPAVFGFEAIRKPKSKVEHMPRQIARSVTDIYILNYYPLTNASDGSKIRRETALAFATARAANIAFLGRTNSTLYKVVECIIWTSSSVHVAIRSTRRLWWKQQLRSESGFFLYLSKPEVSNCRLQRNPKIFITIMIHGTFREVKTFTKQFIPPKVCL